MIQSSRLPLGLAAALILAVPAASAATSPADAVSQADRAFVAKVSQGGMYEVEASKLAKDKAVRQDVLDTGNTEVHDHDLVGEKLKGIVGHLGLPFPSALDAEFATKLDHLKSLSGPAFDAAYIKDMDAVHAADGAAFAQEATSGTNPALRGFAAETVLIVKRHIGSLGAVALPSK